RTPLYHATAPTRRSSDLLRHTPRAVVAQPVDVVVALGLVDVKPVFPPPVRETPVSDAVGRKQNRRSVQNGALQVRVSRLGHTQQLRAGPEVHQRNQIGTPLGHDDEGQVV